MFTALGAASACWENMTKTGTFQSERAREIGIALLERIADVGMLHEIATEHRITKSQAQSWTRRRDFPKPVAELRAGLLYNLEEVRAWKRMRDSERG